MSLRAVSRLLPHVLGVWRKYQGGASWRAWVVRAPSAGRNVRVSFASPAMVIEIGSACEAKSRRSGSRRN